MQIIFFLLNDTFAEQKISADNKSVYLEGSNIPGLKAAVNRYLKYPSLTVGARFGLECIAFPRPDC